MTKPAFKDWNTAALNQQDNAVAAIIESSETLGWVCDPETRTFLVLKPDGSVVDSARARAYVAKHGKPPKVAPRP